MSRSVAQSRDQRIDTLLQKAGKRAEKFEYDAAYKLCKKAYREDPQNVKVLEQLGSVACELDRMEDAKRYYEKLITVAPEHSHVAYFELAQFVEGLESLSFYEHGINIIRSKLAALGSAAESDAQRTSLNRSLSEAFSSVAELYFTDLCDEDNAEERCRASIEQAIAADASNADAYRLQCQFFLIKRQLDEARNSMKKCLEKWHPRYRADSQKRSAKNKANEQTDDVKTPEVSFAVRLECVKNLIELKMLEEADEALLTLANEDDESATVWYLLGTTGYLEWSESAKAAGSINNDAAESKDQGERDEVRKTSVKNLRKALKLANRSDELDEDALSKVSQMLSELCGGRNAGAMETDTNESSDEEDETPANEADWETVSESDGEVDSDEDV